MRRHVTMAETRGELSNSAQHQLYFLRIHPQKLPEHLPRALEVSEVCLLLDAARASRNPERDTALLVFMLETGCRRGAVVGLTMDRLHVEEGYAVVLTKGNQEQFVFFEAEVQEALRTWLEVRGPAPGSIFGLTGPGILQLLERLGERAGVDVYPHKLRHTSATMRVEEGIDSSSLQQVMGWKSTRMAEVYTRLARERLRRRAVATSPMRRLRNGHRE